MDEQNSTGESTYEVYRLAHQMRIVLSDIVASHQNKDEDAFYSSVEIAQLCILQYVNFEKNDWKILCKK